ncbi:MAG: formylglycine-generating enzyme family protein [Prevotellaceae bacterium]|jgi:formylglycine-generating enzyme required for sulfatase activity|nr:formylglycine-generating enzyme family protein [Prevotellaceae bacterium]
MKHRHTYIQKVTVLIATLAILLTKINAQEPEMVFVKGGTFTMGCTSEQLSDCYGNEQPTHLVTLSDFYIGKYPVTQKQWEQVMGTSIEVQRDFDGPGFSLYGQGDNYPMYYVSWEDAQEFVRKLSSATGKKYRLPTEAQWEFAARGGTISKGYRYSGSNDINEVGWHDKNNNGTAHPVGLKKPNELGIYDMSGNIWEWCSDYYDDYKSDHQVDPMGPSTGLDRAMRGGNWECALHYCRVSFRDFNPQEYRYHYLGFRVVMIP